MTLAYNLHDLRELARKRLPKGIFEYIDRGAEDEVAVRENRAAFDRIRVLPRVLRDVTGRSAETSLFGQPMAMPVAVAPTGSAGLVWYQGELELARAAGIDVNVIPYKGTPPAVQDTVGGQVSFVIADLSTLLPLISSGKLRPLAVLSDERIALLPEVPTLKEKGLGATALHSWAGLFAPAKTSPAVIQRLAGLLEQAVKSEAFRKYTADVRSDAVFLGPAALGSFQKSQIEAYREAMVVAGLEAQ